MKATFIRIIHFMLFYYLLLSVCWMNGSLNSCHTMTLLGNFLMAIIVEYIFKGQELMNPH